MSDVALTVESAYPLRTPLPHFDPDSATCPDVPICTLMATDEGWDWIAGNAHDIDRAAKVFASAVLAAEVPSGHWITAHFSAGFTLATRGAPKCGMISAALLELDRPAERPGEGQA